MGSLTPTNAKTLSKDVGLQKKFEGILGENSKYFMQSVMNSISSNKKLLECEGTSVWSAAMNAAVLGLPVDSNLSYSAIIPFGKKAEFQIMTKGYTQLAIDTGLYRNIHVIEVYEDELEFYDPIHNKAYFTDKSNWKQRDNNEKNKIVGYYAFIELINGFYKEDYLTKENALAHGKKYSKSFNRSDSIWKVAPDAMGKKTVLKNLLKNYGKLGESSKLAKAIRLDQSFNDNFDTDNPRYEDNPYSNDDINIEVEDDFVDPLESENKN